REFMANLHRAGRLLVGCTCGLLSALALAQSASAGSVRGALELPRDAQPARVDPSTADHYWRVWNGVLEPRPGQLDATKELLVVLTSAEAPEAPPTGCAFALRGGDLRPSTLAVRPGDELTIANTDAFSHVLRVAEQEGLERVETPPGNARTLAFDAAGTYTLSDENFPHVAGAVHALPGLVACGALDSRGAYAFADLPAGAYTLRVLRGDSELA